MEGALGADEVGAVEVGLLELCAASVVGAWDLVVVVDGAVDCGG